MAIVSIGCDIAEIKRLEALWRAHGNRFLNKVLSPYELDQFLAKTDASKAEFLASRWALKEAVIKCLGPKIEKLPWFNEIEIRKDQAWPVISLKNENTLDWLKQNSLVFHCTLSHEMTHALAFVILEKI